jgi:hypothetical protein
LGDESRKTAARAELEKKITTAVEALTAYEQVVNTCSTTQKEHCSSFLPKIITQIQQDDEQSRTLVIKTGLQKYNELAISTYSKVLEAHREIAPIFDDISAKFDSDLFSKMINCHAQSISDVKMFEILVFSCLYGLIFRIMIVIGEDLLMVRLKRRKRYSIRS